MTEESILVQYFVEHSDNKVVIFGNQAIGKQN